LSFITFGNGEHFRGVFINKEEDHHIIYDGMKKVPCNSISSNALLRTRLGDNYVPGCCFYAKEFRHFILKEPNAFNFKKDGAAGGMDDASPADSPTVNPSEGDVPDKLTNREDDLTGESMVKTNLRDSDADGTKTDAKTSEDDGDNRNDEIKDMEGDHPDGDESNDGNDDSQKDGDGTNADNRQGGGLKI
jgi:hypothetical protein